MSYTMNQTRDWNALAKRIKHDASQLGFQQTGITDTQLKKPAAYLQQWLADGKHGDMYWMARNNTKRTKPDALLSNTLRIISVRMNYLSSANAPMQTILNQTSKAYISRYALGRDYHKLMRKRLQKLADQIQQTVGPFGYRVFVDSAPVMEKPLANKAGLGWIGKHTNVINRQAGSWFFLGEIYTDLPLPTDEPETSHCGECHACIDVCPTKAITAPYQLDARRCISYLTIEHPGSIPVELRPLIGNRIYGCDDCQICCPWNRLADFTHERDFHPRHRLDDIELIELFQWSQETFLNKTQGSAIRRIGYERWLRNIAVAIGNARLKQARPLLQAKLTKHSAMLDEHLQWAIGQLDQ